MDSLLSLFQNEWVLFNSAVVALLILDLFVLNKKDHVIKIKEALMWSAFWVSLALLFGVYVWNSRGSERGMEFFTAYLVEQSLSIDNLFVFAVIFESFKIERKHQHRLLFWGILGAIVLRAIMILAGSQLIDRFHFLIYIFGGILLFTGIKFLIKKDDEHFDPKKSKVYRWAERFLPLTDLPHNGHFRKYDPVKKQKVFTLYFVTLLIIESTDVIFAVDSVPAVLSISRDPFIVFTSNIFAILGLRSLFFVLEDMLHRFKYLPYALGVILTFVGTKMLIEHWYKIPIWLNLTVILGSLLIAVLLSFIPAKKG